MRRTLILLVALALGTMGLQASQAASTCNFWGENEPCCPPGDTACCDTDETLTQRAWCYNCVDLNQGYWYINPNLCRLP